MSEMRLSSLAGVRARLRMAVVRLFMSLSRSKSSRSLLRLMTRIWGTWKRSNVVKRLPQPLQPRRRRMARPSSAVRESLTWVSSLLQKGHFMRGILALIAAKNKDFYKKLKNIHFWVVIERKVNYMLINRQKYLATFKRPLRVTI